uniref:Uncharacterized protein n=1 Tax=Panagrolaimus davidi TaxID=227884 RepID=A0A914QFB4_9BILA
MTDKRRTPQVIIDGAQVMEQNADGSCRKICAMSFAPCTLQGDEFEAKIHDAMRRALERLNRGVSPPGIFRYILRSEHLENQMIGFNNPDYTIMTADELHAHLMRLVQNLMDTRVFRDLICLELIYTAS